MAEVIFFEKPGCAGNIRQKQMLEAAGHRLVVRDLFVEPWTAETLRPFFGDRPVAQWFNRQAPDVKAGVIDPDAYDERTALKLLLAAPWLIRRPLLQVGTRRECGFDTALVDAWIGLPQGASRAVMDGCPKHEKAVCPKHELICQEPAAV